ncbi:MAG: hypothetical protein J6B13_02225 [Muribaculaceae bacterium]|nr:hypothetical protein [Muribaculaceae bacterium]
MRKPNIIIGISLLILTAIIMSCTNASSGKTTLYLKKETGMFMNNECEWVAISGDSTKVSFSFNETIYNMPVNSREINGLNGAKDNVFNLQAKDGSKVQLHVTNMPNGKIIVMYVKSQNGEVQSIGDTWMAEVIKKEVE